MKRETPSIPPCGPSATWKNCLTSGIGRNAEGFLGGGTLGIFAGPAEARYPAAEEGRPNPW